MAINTPTAPKSRWAENRATWKALPRLFRWLYLATIIVGLVGARAIHDSVGTHAVATIAIAVAIGSSLGWGVCRFFGYSFWRSGWVRADGRGRKNLASPRS